jgi:hypothetical protein
MSRIAPVVAALLFASCTPAVATEKSWTVRLAEALFPSNTLVCGPIQISADSPTTLRLDAGNLEQASMIEIRNGEVYIGGHQCELRCRFDASEC